MADGKTRRALNKRLTLPSVAELPAGVVLTLLPGIGDTWYLRGVGYWIRRLGMSLAFVCLFLANGAFVLGILGSITQGKMPYFAIGFACLAIGGVWTGWLCSRRLGNAAVRSVLRIRLPALNGWKLDSRRKPVSVLLAVTSALTCGFTAALFLRTFLPVLDSEIVARAKLLNVVNLHRTQAARVEHLRKNHPQEYDDLLGYPSSSRGRTSTRPGVPPDWKWVRVQGLGLPRGVTLLSLPYIGTTWYQRGPAYVRARLWAGTLFLVVGVLYAFVWIGVMIGVYRTLDTPVFAWALVAVSLFLAGLGGAAAFLDRPLTRITKLVLEFGTPAWMAGRALRAWFWPIFDGEDFARADIDRQLVLRGLSKAPSGKPSKNASKKRKK